MQRIKIERFMAINLADIEITKTVVLIGEQASGKSTIAKLIYFFKSLRDDYIYFISENLDNLQPNGQFLQSKFWAEISRKFYRFFGAIQHLPDFQIQYYYSDQKQITLYLSQGDDGRKKLKIKFSNDLYKQAVTESMPIIKRLKDVYSSKLGIFESSVYRGALEELSRHVSKLFEEDHQPVFIPAGRNMAVTYADFFKQNFYGRLSSDLALMQDEENMSPRFTQDTYIMIQFLQRVQIMVDTFKGTTFEALLESANSGENGKIILDKIRQILKGEYTNDSNFGEMIRFNDTGYVLLNNASSGQQEIIRVLQDVFLCFLNKQKVFRVIEEPEAHLFPMAQKRLLEIIVFMLNSTDSQIVITTHSPYILSIVNNLLFSFVVAEKNGTSIIPKPLFQLKPSETRVYSLAGGNSNSIINSETNLIDQNALDTISDELTEEFENLYDSFANRREQ